MEITGLQAFEQVYKKFGTRYQGIVDLMKHYLHSREMKIFFVQRECFRWIIVRLFSNFVFYVSLRVKTMKCLCEKRYWISKVGTRVYCITIYIFLCCDNFISSAKYTSIDGKIILISLPSSFSLRKPIFQNFCSLANFFRIYNRIHSYWSLV